MKQQSDIMFTMERYAPATSADVADVAEQLGRNPRGMVAIGARAGQSDLLRVPAGEILVVLTAPRVEPRKPSGKSVPEVLEPFPTTFYLTHPTYTAAISRLEASGFMKELQSKLESDSNLQAQYLSAHKKYIEFRDKLGKKLGFGSLETHRDFSAGGMPQRVKCLHALAGHALATQHSDGTSDNPIGDIALSYLYANLSNLSKQSQD